MLLPKAGNSIPSFLLFFRATDLAWGQTRSVARQQQPIIQYWLAPMHLGRCRVTSASSSHPFNTAPTILLSIHLLFFYFFLLFEQIFFLFVCFKVAVNPCPHTYRLNLLLCQHMQYILLNKSGNFQLDWCTRDPAAADKPQSAEKINFSWTAKKFL